MRARTCLVLLLVGTFVAQAFGQCLEFPDFPNAENGCDHSCERRCETFASCQNCNGQVKCQCKEGYKFDSNTYECVRAEDCSS